LALFLSAFQDCNLMLRELPLPPVFAAGPVLPSAKREAARASDAAEAARVLSRFGETAAGLCPAAISRVWRVQNRRLWARYADRRSEVADVARCNPHAPSAATTPSEIAPPAAGGALLHAANERLLFHGADAGTICAIVAGGFECRIASMGGALGAGAYFAEHASYSNNYSKMPPHAHGPAGARGAPAGALPPGAQPAWLRGVPAHLRAGMLAAADASGAGGAGGPPPGAAAEAEALAALTPASGQLLMIVSRVSLGRTGQASPQMRIAPPGFQSVGDNPRGSCQIYAVFDNYQAYPEWVIQYDPARVAPGGAPGGVVPGVMAAAMMPPLPGAAAMAAAMAAAAMAGAWPMPRAAKRRRGR
jgi:hypothetical protein